MKFSILRFKKNSIPSLSSIRPAIFDVSHFWFVSLIVFFAIFFITMAIGFKLFYYGYNEDYKKKTPVEEFQNLIDINKLKTAVEKRNQLITASSTIPRDPSFK